MQQILHKLIADHILYLHDYGYEIEVKEIFNNDISRDLFRHTLTEKLAKETNMDKTICIILLLNKTNNHEKRTT